ncbi:DUF1801 domain-containing protein [Acholeplasma manati]|uniref:DUF1801 domain-containing protein n=1 Tax=Paracholeplasma manati TaxID=591373 RepID=A0ABT2Y6R1_9MOLU|nr:DUF1801 domain-containing protein [Paracholeplasma manati]MCV2232424.1 DUF1801 domain-containing protein [Paracholeplasma manati]
MDITNESIQSYIEQLSADRYEAILWIVNEMKQITNREPKLWGTIIGFGKLYYKYKTGHDGHMPILALSSRKQAITLYLTYNIEQYEEIKTLGKCTYGKGCLYIKKLSDVDLNVLKRLMRKSYEDALKYDFITLIE